MREIKRTDSQGTQIRKAIDKSLRGKLSQAQARAVGRGNEYLPTDTQVHDDQAEHSVSYTFRYYEQDAGDYTTPTADAFETVAIDNSITPTVNTWGSTNGDINFSDEITTPTWYQWSVRVFSEKETDLKFTVDTTHSFAVTVDDVLVDGSSSLGPNLISDVAVSVASGESEVELGLYATSGTVRFRLGGEPAKYVKSMTAPDKSAPSAPNNPTVTAQQSDPQNGSMRMKLEFAQKTTSLDWDIAYYDILRVEKTTNAAPPTDNEYTYHMRAGVPPSGESIELYDPHVKYGLYYTYKGQATDRAGNKSLYSAGITTQAIDSTAPSGATNLTEETAPWPTLTHLTWAWPDTTITENEDLKGGYITSGSVGGKKMSTVMYDGSTSGAAFFPTTPGSSITYYLTCFDWAGNLSTAVSTPIGDTSAPGNITDLYYNGPDGGQAVDTATITGEAFKAGVLFEIEPPSDTDLEFVDVYVQPYDAAAMMADSEFDVAWAAAELIARLPAQPSTYIAYDFVSHYNSQETFIFFNAVDKSGNAYGDAATPYGVKIETNAFINTDTLSIITTPVANEFGYHNTLDFSIDMNAIGDDGSLNNGGQFSIEGGAWTNEPTTADNNITWDETGLTNTSGTNVSFRRQDTENFWATATVHFKVDAVTPTAGSLSAANKPNGLTLTITPGTTTGFSGIHQTLLYRNTSNDSGTATLIATLDGTTTEYEDNTVSNGTTYYYWTTTRSYSGLTSAFSTVESITAYSMLWAASVNWFDNSSFEYDDPTGNDHLRSWTSAGGTPTGAGGFHGDRRAGLTNSRTLKQSNIPIPFEYYYLSVYCSRLSAAGSTTGRLQLDFKDGRGDVLQTINLDTSANGITGSDWTRHSGDGSDLWVIGRSGTSAPNLYNVNASKVDITLQTTDGTFGYLDAIQMQTVVSGGVGTWNSVETKTLAPTEYYDSEVMNTDRLNALVIATDGLFANNITAGKLSAANDPLTFFDLDNDEVRITASGDSWTTLTPSRISRTQDSGNTFWDYAPYKMVNVDKSLASITSYAWNDVFASGTFNKPPFSIIGTQVRGENNPAGTASGWNIYEVGAQAEQFPTQVVSGWTRVIAVSGATIDGATWYNYSITGYWNWDAVSDIHQEKNLQVTLLNTTTPIVSGGIFGAN